MKIIEDQELQTIADTKTDVQDEADLYYELDVNDCDDYIGAHVTGFQDGLDIANQVLKMQEDTPTAQIFRINFDDYADNDGVSFYIGTKEQVKKRLEGLTNRRLYQDEEADES